MNGKQLHNLGMYAVIAGGAAFVGENFISSLKTPTVQMAVKWLIIGGVALLVLGWVL